MDTVNVSEKYSDKIADRFKIGSLTDSPPCDCDDSFVGAKTVKVSAWTLWSWGLPAPQKI